MKTIFCFTLIALFAIGPLSAQRTSAGKAGARSQDSTPMNSPEPITMIALAGGAAAVGFAARRRKKK